MREHKFIYECDCGGDCGGSTGADSASFDGGCDCCNGHGGTGCFGPGCFHVPFPIFPQCCSFRPYVVKAGKKKKKTCASNPYAAGMKIVKETEIGDDVYGGLAQRMFDRVVGGTDPIYSDVVYKNNKLKLGWSLNEDGTLNVYTPINYDGEWKIVKQRLTETGLFEEEKTDYGKYSTSSTAYGAILDEADRHMTELNKRHAGVSVNPRSLERELKQRFSNQFDSVKLTDKGGTWEIVFTAPLPNGKRLVKGYQQTMEVMPQLQRIMTFLRARGVQANGYDISVKASNA